MIFTNRMNVENKISIEEFYKQTKTTIPEDIKKGIGHFNVFEIPKLLAKLKNDSIMPYNRRAYYKISLIKGKNCVEYADKVIHIEQSALLFATPEIPYNYYSLDEKQDGSFCIFTRDFLIQSKSGVSIDTLPIFQPNIIPVLQLSEIQSIEIEAILNKMQKEITSDYIYKYDLLRTYVIELIHLGQKLQPMNATHPKVNAATRITSLFVELLERQFPIESSHQKLGLKTATEYADRLAIHVNHLNKVLKENTGFTTKAFINNRVLQEAKILLKQTDWSVSDIAYSLGYEELSHFSNFFKKQTSTTPLQYRNHLID